MANTKLKDRLKYDSRTGMFIWVKPKGRKLKKGSIAGTVRKDGYVKIKYDGNVYSAHRLAWEFEYGEIPEGMVIDHIDHNPSNNRIDNLRLVTQQENMMNQKLRSTNSSGTVGVSKTKYGTYRAQICVCGDVMYLGSHGTLEDAIQARIEAEVLYGFHTNNGKVA